MAADALVLAPLIASLVSQIAAGGCFETVPTSDPQIARALVLDQGAYYGIGPQLILQVILGDFMGYRITPGNSANPAPGAPAVTISPAIQMPASPNDLYFGQQAPANLTLLGLLSKQVWEGIYISNWLHDLYPNLSDWRAFRSRAVVDMFTTNPPTFPGVNLTGTGAFMWDDPVSWYYISDYQKIFAQLGLDFTVLNYVSTASFNADLLAMQASRTPALFWASPFNYQLQDLNATRVSLPPFDPDLYLDDSGAVSGRCDFPVYRFGKYVALDLNVTSPWAFEVMTQFDITSDDYMWMQAYENSVYVSNLQSACQWAKANERRWKQWIPVAFFRSEICSAGQENIGRFADALNRTFCAECRPGHFSANGSACVPCPMGTFADAPGMSSCQPCPYLSTTLHTGSRSLSDCLCTAGSYERIRANTQLVCIACDPTGYASSIGQLQCTPCQSHSTTNTTGATSAGSCACTEGYYEAQEGHCQACPGGAQCAGSGAMPLAKVGYWSSAGNPLEFYLCSSPGRCPGGLQPGTCPAGYDDVLCADCQSGWYTSGPICKECRSSIWQVTLTAAFFLLIAVPCLIIFITIDMTKNRQNEHSSVSWTVAVRQAVEFCQLLSVVGGQVIRDVTFAVPKYITAVGSVSTVFSLSPGQFEVECLLKTSWTLSYTVRTTVLNTFAALVITATVLKQYSPRFLPLPHANKLLSGSLRLLDILYIYYLSTLLELFKCYEQPTSPGLYTSEYDARIRCYAPGQWMALLPTAIVGLFLATIAYPLMVGAIMWSAPSQTSNDDFFEIFAHYFRPYHNKMWFWYCPTLLRKLLVSFLLSSIGSDDSSTTAIGAMIVCAHLAGSDLCRPYFHNVNNRLEMVLGTSLLSVLILLLAMESVPANHQASVNLITVLILILLIGSLCIALWTILTELARTLDANKHPILCTALRWCTMRQHVTQPMLVNAVVDQAARAHDTHLLSEPHVRQWIELASDDEIVALKDAIESLSIASGADPGATGEPGPTPKPPLLPGNRIHRPSYVRF
ncbi:Tyrosine-protein kinase ephrin type A/B receptor-like domain-containing protein [Plasmodiophora brassicae]